MSERPMGGLDRLFVKMETDWADQWWKGLVAGVVISAIGIALMISLGGSGGTVNGVLRGFAMVGIVASWFLLILSIYMDARHVEKNSEWEPNIGIYFFAVLFFPVIGLVVVLIYLLLRHRAMGIP